MPADYCLSSGIPFPFCQVVLNIDHPLQGKTLTLMEAHPSVLKLGLKATLNRLLCSHSVKDA